MGIKLNSITLLVAPLVFLTGVVKVHIARELFAKAECSRSLRLVLRPVKFGLDDEMIWAPRIGEVHIFQVYRFKAVILTCIPEKKKFEKVLCVRIWCLLITFCILRDKLGIKIRKMTSYNQIESGFHFKSTYNVQQLI